MNLTVVTNVLAPYRDDIFCALGRRYTLVVFALARDEPGRRWERSAVPFPHRYVPAIRVSRALRPAYLPFPTWMTRRGWILVAGFGLPTLLTVVFRPGSTLIWSEATTHTEAAARRESSVRRWFRHWLVARARAGVAVGTESSDYLRELGARATLVLPNVIDPPPLLPRPPIPQNRVVVAHVGDWSHAKGADVAARVYGELKRLGLRAGFETEFLIAGNVDGAAVPAGSELLGYLERGLLWERLRERGVVILLLMSRRDTWGFVVAEAMARGIVPIASPNVGSAADLLRPIHPGLVASSAAEAAAFICRLRADPEFHEALVGRLCATARRRTAEWAATAFQTDLAALQSHGRGLD